MSDLPATQWLRRGGVTAKLAKTWLVIFLAIVVATVAMVTGLGRPTPETAGLFIAVCGGLTMMVVAVAFGPADSLKRVAVMVVGTIGYYGVAVLPATAVGGMIFGLARRVFA